MLKRGAMLKRMGLCVALILIAAAPLASQSSDFGLAVPVTISAGGMYSHRLQIYDRKDDPYAAGFRLMVYPTLKLGSGWFAYAALQARSMPYYYYDAFFSTRDHINTDVIQAYVGYSHRFGKTSAVFKVGHLSSAFGSFPLHYDDSQNLVIDQPLTYITEIPLRADQITCGVTDQGHQSYGSVGASCGGAAGRAPGLMPVTLYGLPAAEADVSSGRVDLRAQLTGSSPANTQNFLHAGQYLQWAAGGGYTIVQGFRVGASAFRGPYLDRSVTPWLPAGTSIRSFSATGLGLDVQYARGWWTVNGEMQHFTFPSPNWVVSPSFLSSYVEAKRMLSPRFYLAGRAGRLTAGSVTDRTGLSMSEFAPALTSIEFATGVWFNRHQSLKVSYSWLKSPGSLESEYNVLGFQFVTTLRALDQAFR